MELRYDTGGNAITGNKISPRTKMNKPSEKKDQNIDNLRQECDMSYQLLILRIVKMMSTMKVDKKSLEVQISSRNLCKSPYK